MKQVFVIWDRTNNKLTDQDGQILSASSFVWYRGDTFVLCVTARRYNATTQAFDDENLPPSSTFQLMIKLGRFKTGEQDGTQQLAFVDADGWDNPADWADAAAGSAKHCVRLALTDSNLAALLTVTSAPVSPILEITETLSGGFENTVEQQVTIYPDINRGGAMGIVTPTYYTAAQVDAAIASALAAKLRIAPGKRLVIEADGSQSVEDV